MPQCEKFVKRAYEEFSCNQLFRNFFSKNVDFTEISVSKLGDNVSLYGQKICQNDAMIPCGVE